MDDECFSGLLGGWVPRLVRRRVENITASVFPLAMKITLQTQDYSNDDRRAKWWHSRGYKFSGNPRRCPMATREECRIHLQEYGRSLDADMNDEWARAIEQYEANGQLNHQ